MTVTGARVRAGAAAVLVALAVGCTGARTATDGPPRAAPVADPGPASTSPVLAPPAQARSFTDDFAAADSGWAPDLDEPGLAGGYVGGTYRVAVEGEPRAVAVPSPVMVEPGEADVLIVAEATVVDGAGRFGLFCRQDERFGSRYLAVVDREGGWGLYRDAAGRVIPLAGGEAGDAPVSAAGSNRLELSCAGGLYSRPTTLAFAVNGQQVGVVEDARGVGRADARQVGLVVALDADGGAVDVAFGDFRIAVAADLRLPSGSQAPIEPSPSAAPSATAVPLPSRQPRDPSPPASSPSATTPPLPGFNDPTPTAATEPSPDPSGF